MHSNIFALIGIIPVIAIGYLHKTSGIAKMVGIEDWVIDIREMSESELINKIDNLLKKRSEYVDQLKNKMPTLVKEANKAGILIRDDYASLRKKKNEKKN
jgi:polysaccharide pyruvyl transferase WcaK-like protein